MFTKVEDMFWKDEKMRNASDDIKLLMLYVLTSPHRNILGFYFLPIQYIAGDLKWGFERVSKGLGELFRMGLITYDETNSVILIKNFLKHNPLENSNQVKSAVRKIDEVPKSSLYKDFERVLKRLGKPLYKPLLERLGKQVEVEVDVEVKEEVILLQQETRASEGEIYQFFNQNIGPVSPFQSQVISQHLDDGMEPEMIIAVLQDSLGKGEPWTWINRVLTNSLLNEVKTLERYETEKAKRQNNSRDKPKERGGQSGTNKRDSGNDNEPIEGIGIEL